MLLKENSNIKKISLPNTAIFIVVIACFVIDFGFKNWEKLHRVIEHDVHWYYGYLPLTFIYHDIKMEKSSYQFAEDYYLIWTVQTPEGKQLIKTTYGLAVLYAPFFFVANIFANFSDYEANGFSEPYKFFLLLSAIFYLIVGFDFLKKILRHFNFSDKIITATILLIGLGTNLLCYASQSAAMPHVYNFFLFSIFIFYTIKWHKESSIKNSLAIGISFGLISLIRPSNALIVLFFIFYGISNFSDLKRNFSLFKKEFLQLILIAFLCFLVWVPQLFYWKITTGHFVYYSYNNERFFWTEPKILEGLFSFRKGWLLYTPMMAFALFGIFFMNDELKKLRTALIVFLIPNIYIIFSWWCWWYGGTFGQRSMIESYMLLAIPFASFLKFISEKKSHLKILFFCLAAFFVLLNGFQTLQFEINSLHWDGMTKELYFKQFGKLSRIPDFDKYASPPNVEIIENFVTETSKQIINLKAYNGKFVCADGAFNDLVVANRDNPWEWETFSLLKFHKNKCALKSYKIFFWSLNKENSTISATGSTIKQTETFTIVELENNIVAFKASNGKYLSVDESRNSAGQVFANADEIGEKEKFEMIKEIK